MADGADPSPQPGPAATPPPVPGSTFAPFSYPAFRAIWLANLFSQLGGLIQAVGAAWLMTELTRSHTLVAAVQASTTLPILLLGVFAGAIADNFDRRRVMLAAQWGMLIASAVLAVLTFQGMIGPAGLLAFTLMVGAGTALNGPAWQASVRAQVGPRDLPQAISLNTIAFNLARSVGPALGGLLIAAAGVAAGFAINALSYVALIVVLMRWRPEVPPPVRLPIVPSIKAGIRFCRDSRPVRRVLLRGLCTGIGVATFSSLLPPIVRDRLHGTEFSYGVILGAFGVGSIIAALFVGKLRRKHGTEAVVSAGVICFVVALIGLALVDTVNQLLPFAFIGGIGWTVCMTTLNVSMQLRSPEAILGRCLSIYQAVTFGGMALGAWSWGMLADAASLQTAVLAGAGFLLASLIVLRLVAPMPAPGEGVTLVR